jgi:hypothetical protein
VVDPDATAEAAALVVPQPPPPVWDGVERRIIPAFPGARPNAGHLKTADDVVWHPDRALGLYSVPDKIQEDIDRLEQTSFNPWRKRENYAERAHTLLYIEVSASTHTYQAIVGMIQLPLP